MAEFISQESKPSNTARTQQRTAFLESLDNDIQSHILDYYRLNPWGYQVTLQVLFDLGKEKIESLVQEHKRSLGEIKQCLGLRIPILLCDLIGEENVLTYRDTKTLKNSKRPLPSDYKELSGWVSSYTPHMIKKEWMENYMNGIIEAVK